MNERIALQKAKRIGTGLAFILVPTIFIFAFSVHPGLLNPHLLEPEALILRAHQNELLQFGHMLVTLATVLLIVIALRFMHLLESTSGWAGTIGAVLAIIGAVILAADKGALCLTMSALDKISEVEFAQMMPGLLAIFSKGGWLVILWGIVFIPVGFAIQAVALYRNGPLGRWQSVLFMIGVLLVATPDGFEIINLSASILMAVALIPYGMSMMRQA